MIHEWEENCQSLEEEVVSLRTNLDGINIEKDLNEKIAKDTRKLDQILNSQRPLGIKTGLGYSKT